VNSFFDIKFFWEVFVTLLVITDPPGTVPVFLGMTQGRPAAERNRLAWQAAMVAFGVIVIFALFGRSILSYLGVELPALQTAGGARTCVVPEGANMRRAGGREHASCRRRADKQGGRSPWRRGSSRLEPPSTPG
jgi:small neutral amino acid transporter SnatA (MarC family)